MGKARHGVLPAESLVKQHVQRCRRQPLFATDDVRNFHQMVVDDVCQMICGQLVGTLVEHLVIEDVALHAHLATNHVVYENLATRINLETHHILLAIVDECCHLVGRHGERVAHHATRASIVLEVLNLSALLLQFLRSVEGDVCLAGFEQLVDILLIDGATFALAIRPVLAAKRHALVELDVQPLERFKDVLLGSRHETVRVGVLNSENKIALMLTGKQVIIQCGANAANVQCPSGTWCETHPNSSFFHR